MTRMQQSEADELAALHELWLDSHGRHGQQLWLEDADLSGLEFSRRVLVDSLLSCVHLDGANLVDADLAGAQLVGSSLRHADLHGANLGKANLDTVHADHAQLIDASRIRCTLRDADLRGTNMDGADLRGCTMRFATLDRCWFVSAVLGPTDATGASGTIGSGAVIWEADGQRRVLDVDQLLEILRAAGAGDITAFTPGI